MHFFLKNNFLYINHYKIKCAIGKRGISKNKKEGDLKTPRGIFKFETLFYRKDRLGNVKANIPKKIIKKNMGWCDDPNSSKYNKLIEFPFKKSAERFFLKKKIYDLILVLNYNRSPIIKNKGSAIFLHVSERHYKPTKGCISVNKKDFMKFLPLITRNTKIIIN